MSSVPACLLAAASDLKAFFAVVGKEPAEVRVAHGRVVRLADGEAGLSSRTIKRRYRAVLG